MTGVALRQGVIDVCHETGQRVNEEEVKTDVQTKQIR
jgi:hypothetical protein